MLDSIVKVVLLLLGFGLLIMAIYIIARVAVRAAMVSYFEAKKQQYMDFIKNRNKENNDADTD